MTTLEDLYYGNIVPHEHSFKRGSAYSEVLSYVIRHQDSLILTLTVRQKEIFEKLKDCEAELHGMNEREAFISGFKLAARIMTEVFVRAVRGLNKQKQGRADFAVWPCDFQFDTARLKSAPQKTKKTVFPQKRRNIHCWRKKLDRIFPACYTASK